MATPLKNSEECVTLPESWLAATGNVAAQIGQPDFHTQMLGLLASLIPNQAAWIIAYAPGVLPNVLHTNDVASSVTTDYNSTFRCFDPFWHLWRRRTQAPAVTLSTLDSSVKPDEYTRIFQKKHEFSDELGLLLPIHNNACVMLFLQKGENLFTNEELRLTHLIQPLFNGLHRAHVAQTLHRFSTIDIHENSSSTGGSLVLDRHGNRLYGNAAWHEAEKLHGPILLHAIYKLLGTSGQTCHTEPQRFVLRLVVLPEDCMLAPGGRLLVFNSIHFPAASDDLPHKALNLTPRERELLQLILQGRCTGEIAQHMGVSKGTVKNHRLRLYRKTGVTSERALINLSRSING
ncbi:helix-turn-helix transcriptional regulator [Acetobacter estunensis]|uniref:helix-turn-helix transcriptional regulator n=1 Tax=Acetobacter estunensis TaxID=104097 RepID=UPI001C2D0CFA|nr:helix-turn-helix transcriptional regulator [Acetobacter estunensis]MBV1837054.1 helix-turn-helix transcriptional regulator [Acetobacter estunensis]